MLKLSELQQKIVNKRSDLIEFSKNNELTSVETVKLSNELDELIYAQMKESLKKEDAAYNNANENQE